MGLSQGHASVVQGQIPEEHKQGDLALNSSILATEFFLGYIFLLVLGSCSEIPLSGPPSPIEGHNRDHLEETHQLANDLNIEVFVKCSTAEQIDTYCRPQ